MPRALWSGSLSFGLVNVLVQLVSGARDLDYHFHQLHAKDKVRVEHRRFCSEEEAEVLWEEVGHGYEQNGKPTRSSPRSSHGRRGRSRSRLSSISSRSIRSTSTTPTT